MRLGHFYLQQWTLYYTEEETGKGNRILVIMFGGLRGGAGVGAGKLHSSTSCLGLEGSLSLSHWRGCQGNFAAISVYRQQAGATRGRPAETRSPGPHYSSCSLWDRTEADPPASDTLLPIKFVFRQNPICLFPFNCITNDCWPGALAAHNVARVRQIQAQHLSGAIKDRVYEQQRVL